MRFHPKSRASADHTPGPRSAKAAPTVANKMLAHGSPSWKMRLQSPRAATSDPEMGVYKPAHRSTPPVIASASRVAAWIGGAVSSPSMLRVISAVAATSRSNRRLTPGGPQANVENKRLRSSPFYSVPDFRIRAKPQKSGADL